MISVKRVNTAETHGTERTGYAGGAGYSISGNSLNIYDYGTTYYSQYVAYCCEAGPTRNVATTSATTYEFWREGNYANSSTWVIKTSTAYTSGTPLTQIPNSDIIKTYDSSTDRTYYRFTVPAGVTWVWIGNNHPYTNASNQLKPNKMRGYIVYPEGSIPPDNHLKISDGTSWSSKGVRVFDGTSWS